VLDTLRRNLKGPAALTLFAFTVLTGISPVAHAGMVGTEATLDGAAVAAERAHLLDSLARQDVREMLVARGVDPTLVEQRVAALSDDEVRDLNARMDRMPAGGDIVGTAVFVFLILLLTDLLGWTNVFPFTKKGAIAN